MVHPYSVTVIILTVAKFDTTKQLKVKEGVDLGLTWFNQQLCFDF